MKAWRPEGWNNPYPDGTEEALTEKHLIQALEDPRTNYDRFEAGADAMIEAVREEIMKVENPYLHPKAQWEGFGDPRSNAFEEARQAMLSPLKE